MTFVLGPLLPTSNQAPWLDVDIAAPLDVVHSAVCMRQLAPVWCNGALDYLQPATAAGSYVAAGHPAGCPGLRAWHHGKKSILVALAVALLLYERVQ